MKKSLIGQVSRAVDPEKFLFVLNIYHAAARMTMPVENPQLLKFQVEDKVYSMTDIPMNRGMMAATKELVSQGVSQEERMAYLFRLMHFGELFEHQERFGDLIRPSDEDGSLMVADALMKACAVARIYAEHDRIGFDLDDVLKHAKSFSNEE